jgi:8-oxo-dGTP pyrophosphatase MutT (NUDIX family)
MIFNHQEQFIEHVRRELHNHQPAHEDSAQAKPAAVLLPLYWDNEEWNLLYTRRTDSLESHKGQVSFPGGAVEEHDENAEHTALREAYEEIGIRHEDVEILGSFDKMLTISHFSVTPFVGKIPWPYNLKINHAEVATTFGAPLSWLIEPANLTSEERHIPSFGITVPVSFFKPYNNEIIWGATASITLNFLSLIGLKDD